MRAPLAATGLVLLAALALPACSESPAAPVPPQATMADRDLLLAILQKLDALEARLGLESQTGAPPTTPRGKPQSTPAGVPHQLEAIRAQLAALEAKINTITVGIGLPVPADANLTPSEAFQTTSEVCFKLGTNGNVNLEGKFRTRTEGRGGAGIDFYGNKLLVEVRGDATGLAGAQWNIIEGGIEYSFCVNPRRAEAQQLMAALPLNSQQLEARFSGLTQEVGSRRTNPFELINPSVSLFQLESYPSRAALLSRLDDFFGGLRGDLCGRLKSRFDVVKDLGLGDGNILSSITSPAVGKLQGRFNGDC